MPPVPGCRNNLAISAVRERPGTYSVVVSEAGYQDLRFDNVVVTSGICHVNTVVINARLSP